MSGCALIPPTRPRTAQRAANQDSLARSAKLACNLHSLPIRAFAMARFATWIGFDCYYRAAAGSAIGSR
jgi:hypothetical protein